MNSSYVRGIYLRLAGVVMLVVVVALAAYSALSHRAFESALAPEMSKKVATIAASIRSLVLRAVDSQIEFTQLHGIEQTFDEVKAEIPEISYFALTDAQGTVLHQRLTAGEGSADYFRSAEVLALLEHPDAIPTARRVGKQYMVSLPIVGQNQPLGMLHIGVDVSFVDDIVLGMLLDVLVVLVVSLFFTLELLHFMAGAKLEGSLKALGDAFHRGSTGNFATPLQRIGEHAFGSVLKRMDLALAHVNTAYTALARDIDAQRRVPAHERQPGLAQAQAGLAELSRRFRFGEEAAGVRSDDTELSRVRAPLFIFILAEELTRSFLPGYINELLVPIPGLSPELVLSLPIALFMLIVAIGQPWIGVYCDRVGQRRTMLQGAGIAVVGFVATALASTVLDLLLWRSLCALGYAMVFVAAQAYVLDHSSGSNRARSFAMFIGAIMVATVCGPSIGGILADNIGERPTFLVAAALALGSIAAIRLLPHAVDIDTERVPARVPTLREFGTLLLNRRFMTVTGLAAVPAKILLTGMAFYLVPLYIVAIGSTQAMAGRVLMAYAVVMVLMGPLTASLATTRERMQWLVGGGLIVSGLGGLMMLAGGGVGWVFAAVIGVGLGQSLSIAAQSALVAEHCEAEIRQVGEGAVYGVYRLLERLGNAAGPLLAAALVMHYGYRTSFVAIGGLVLLCGAAFVLATRMQRSLVVAAA